MANDNYSLDIPSSIKEEKPDISNKENEREIIEMAAEQFASLLWQQYLFENRHKNKSNVKG